MKTPEPNAALTFEDLAELVTIEEAAAMLRVAAATVYRWRYGGRLRAWRLEGRLRVLKRELLALLQPVPVKAKTGPPAGREEAAPATHPPAPKPKPRRRQEVNMDSWSESVLRAAGIE